MRLTTYSNSSSFLTTNAGGRYIKRDGGPRWPFPDALCRMQMGHWASALLVIPFFLFKRKCVLEYRLLCGYGASSYILLRDVGVVTMRGISSALWLRRIVCSVAAAHRLLCGCGASFALWLRRIVLRLGCAAARCRHRRDERGIRDIGIVAMREVSEISASSR